MSIICAFAISALLITPGRSADLQILSVQSAASATVGLPLRGGLATVFVRGLEGVPPLITAGPPPLPTELAGVRVAVRGVAAPLLAVANAGDYQQINFQVPNEGAGVDCINSAGAVTVTYGFEKRFRRHLRARGAPSRRDIPDPRK